MQPETKTISLAQARELGLRVYFPGEPCPKGHNANRYVSNRTCCVCTKETYQRRRAENPEYYPARLREWRKTSPLHRAYQQKAHVKAAMSVRRQAWQRANKARVSELSMKHIARKKRAMPWWLTEAQIEEIGAIYRDAASRPGGPWDVDHIVPLQGKTVCGLHVPWNLRVVLASENRSKGNKLLDGLVSA